MQEFQISVSAPPDEVLRRIHSVMSRPYSFDEGWGKDFTGRIDGNRFDFRVTQRFGRNSFRPVCSGHVEPYGPGSVVRFGIGGASKLFPFVIAIPFVLGCGLLTVGGTILRLVLPAGEYAPAEVGLALLGLLFPAAVFSGFIVAIFLYSRWRRGSDQRKMTEMLHTLLRDVTIPAPRA